MTAKEKVEKIVSWLKEYNNDCGLNFVVGVSGGIDSALVSTLCAVSGVKTTLVFIPYTSSASNNTARGLVSEHASWLMQKYDNVKFVSLDGLDTAALCVKTSVGGAISDLTFANILSRLRMVMLYAVASETGSLVVGTGNKVEDFGVGFFTKYGDGGVDISPIGNLTKTDVMELSSFLGIIQGILLAKPTDGLWSDGRTDEDQLGASYPELEWAMSATGYDDKSVRYNDRQKEVIGIYRKLHNSNKHKMCMPPVCPV